ncbi:MAG: hypothetical protein LBS30_07050 [Planctomycetota bacterium]|jgi:hypothetical protein|nr:hypothetical protein [Planctomycetota bacterium]
MRNFHLGLFAVSAAIILAASTAGAGQPIDMNSLSYGMRYCPAPWCDNEEFINTHFGIDAKTGKVTKYVGGAHPYEETVTDGEEQVLYVAPPAPAVYPQVAPIGALAMVTPRPAAPQPQAWAALNPNLPRQSTPVYAAPVYATPNYAAPSYPAPAAPQPRVWLAPNPNLSRQPVPVSVAPVYPAPNYPVPAYSAPIARTVR